MPLAAMGFSGVGGRGRLIGWWGPSPAPPWPPAPTKGGERAKPPPPTPITTSFNATSMIQQEPAEPVFQDGRDASLTSGGLHWTFATVSEVTRRLTALPSFYQNTVNRGVSAITSNPRCGGRPDSGATLKAVSDYGQRTAMSYADRWLNLLSDRVGRALTPPKPSPVRGKAS